MALLFGHLEVCLVAVDIAQLRGEVVRTGSFVGAHPVRDDPTERWRGKVVVAHWVRSYR